MAAPMVVVVLVVVLVVPASLLWRHVCPERMALLANVLWEGGGCTIPLKVRPRALRCRDGSSLSLSLSRSTVSHTIPSTARLWGFSFFLLFFFLFYFVFFSFFALSATLSHRPE